MEAIKNQDLLRQGVQAAKAGDKQQARALLRAALAENPSSEMTWLWLASVAQGPVEAHSCLEEALKINPANKRTRTWLEKLRAKSASAPVKQASSRPKASAWRCPLCDQRYTVQPMRCVRCLSVLSLEDIAAFFEEGKINARYVQDTVSRLEAEEQHQDPVQHHRTLALAYLNLGQFQQAQTNLNTAAALTPEDTELQKATEKLSQRLLRGSEPTAESREDWGTNEIEPLVLEGVLETQRRQPAVKEAPVVAEPEPQRHRVVLVVDDSPTVRKLAAVTLERQGYRVLVAADGMEALAMMREARPDLVVLDITMPNLDGYKICRVIKESEITHDVPVIFLSGKGSFLDKIRGRMAGAVEYITKPVDPNALIQAVARNCLKD